MAQEQFGEGNGPFTKLARLQPSGAADPAFRKRGSTDRGFGKDGLVTIGFGRNADAESRAILVDRRGRLVLGGFVSHTNRGAPNGTAFGLTRYLPAR